MRLINEASPSGKIQSELQIATVLPTAKNASPRITLRLTYDGIGKAQKPVQRHVS